MAMAGTRQGFIDQYGGKLLSHEESNAAGYSEQTFKATTSDDGIMEGKLYIIGRRH